jgi:hypothetical protein
MFTRLAKSELAKFRLIQPWRIAPGLHETELSNRPYSNDNLPGFRRPAAEGRRRSPAPALACHWFYRNGRLECRWRIETNDDATIADLDEYRHCTAVRVSTASRRCNRAACKFASGSTPE